MFDKNGNDDSTTKPYQAIASPFASLLALLYVLLTCKRKHRDECI